jgi:hypothetical protein
MGKDGSRSPVLQRGAVECDRRAAIQVRTTRGSGWPAATRRRRITKGHPLPRVVLTALASRPHERRCKQAAPVFAPSKLVRARPTPDLRGRTPYFSRRNTYGAVRVEIFTVELRTGRAGKRIQRSIYVSVYSKSVRDAPKREFNIPYTYSYIQSPYGTNHIRIRIFKVHTGRAHPIRRRFIRYLGRQTPYGLRQLRICSCATRTSTSQPGLSPSRPRFRPS